MNLSELKAPFPPDRISWRVGSTSQNKDRGLALAYLDARDVQDRLDAVCGPENWQCRYALLGQTTVCEIGIAVAPASYRWVNGGNAQTNPLTTPSVGHAELLAPATWVWKADGAGATDFEAEKGAMSDSFKRAAVKWGIGRYLYDLDSPWVAIEAIGKSFKIKESEYPKLRAILAGKPMLRKEKRELDKKTDAKEWAKYQEEKIFQMTITELRAWEAKCAAAMERMKGIDIDTYEWLEAKIAIRYEQLKAAA